MRRDSLTIYDSDVDGSATHSGINWVELPENIRNLVCTANMSVTSSVVNVFQSFDTSQATKSYFGKAYVTGQRLFSEFSRSATWHAFTEGRYPQYLGVTISATVEGRIVVTAHFERD